MQNAKLKLVNGQGLIALKNSQTKYIKTKKQ